MVYIAYGRDLLKQLKVIRALQRKQDYGTLLLKLNKLLKVHPYFVPALVLKAQSIQMLDDRRSPPPPLAEAKRALLSAIRLDPKAADALNELAFYTFAVEDQTKKALALFERSIGLSFQNLKEAQIGRAKCLLELRRWARCKEALLELRTLYGNDSQVRELEEEYRGTRSKGKAKSSARRKA